MMTRRGVATRKNHLETKRPAATEMRMRKMQKRRRRRRTRPTSPPTSSCGGPGRASSRTLARPTAGRREPALPAAACCPYPTRSASTRMCTTRTAESGSIPPPSGPPSSRGSSPSVLGGTGRRRSATVVARIWPTAASASRDGSSRGTSSPRPRPRPRPRVRGEERSNHLRSRSRRPNPTPPGTRPRAARHWLPRRVGPLNVPRRRWSSPPTPK
mmetsp:Transcript_23555/g.55481  ORF Transcript_23555/g.55481 Transcript_23555/m.55481 type:complete len:214 (+) Transcript_23555:1030-1671(+)